MTRLRWLWWLVPLALVAVRLHNAAALPFHHGYDNYGHVLNLRKVVLEGYLPLGNDGFSGYHPPLYYLASGLLWKLVGSPGDGPWKAAQWLSTLSSLGVLGCVWAAARRFLPGREWFAVTALAALPVELTMAAMIYNIPLAALFAALFLVVLLRAWPRERPVAWEEAALGVLAGACTLTRPDGLALGLVLALLLGRRLLRGGARGEALLSAGLAFACAAGVAGWFYLRNLAEFGRPFVTNWHQEAFPYWGLLETLPGFRSASFYLGGDLELFRNPDFPSQTPYLWGTLYACSWWDHLHFFSTRLEPGTGRLLLVAGLLPTLLAVAGVASVLADRRRRADWWPVLVCAGASLLVFLGSTWALPLYNVVKPIYLFAAFVPWGLFVAEGTRAVQARVPSSEPWLRAALAALALGVAITFWYRG